MGLIVSGIAAYAFLSVSSHMLDEEAYKPVAAIWAVTFTVAPGFFMPVEQEISRAVARRFAIGQGSGPLLRRAALLAFGLLAIIIILASAASPVITRELFDGEWTLFAALLLGISGYCVSHLVRGVLSGRGHFKPYGVYLGAEATIRLLICIALAVVGTNTAGPVGLAIGISPAFAVALVARSAAPDFDHDGPEAPWNELTPSLGALLAGSVCSMALMNAAMIGATILANDAEDAEVKKVFNGVIVARVPLFLFQAVQAALLPRLAALAVAHRFAEFRASLRKLLIVVIGIGLLGTMGGALIGPLVVRIAFDVELGHLDLGLLAAATGFFIVAQSFAQALIALGCQGRVALGWFIGVVVFVVTTALGNDLLLRLELASLIASAAAGVALAVALRQRLHQAEAEAVRSPAAATRRAASRRFSVRRSARSLSPDTLGPR